MPAVEVSVVVCTYNRVDSLRRALSSLLSQETPFSYEVAVIDDACDNLTSYAVEDIAARSPVSLSYFTTDATHGGVAAARNKGVSVSKGHWVAFCDDDQVARPDWLSGLMRVANECHTACVGGSIIADIPAGYESNLGPVCCSLLGEHRFAGPPAPFLGHVLPSSGNLLVERAVFGTVGVFDESISAGEDTEFLDRIRQAGFLIWSAPAAVVYHCIPEHRLQPAYLKWVSLRWGKQFAEIDALHHGCRRAAFNGLERAGQALLLTLPRLIGASARRDAAAVLDQRCLLWRTEGYLRKCLHCCAPRVFPQTRFWSMLEFRKERALFVTPSQKTTHDVT